MDLRLGPAAAAAAAAAVTYGLTCLSVSKDAGVVAHEGVIQQTLPKAPEDDVLTCSHTRGHR